MLVRYFSGPRTGDYLRIKVGPDGEIDRLFELVGEIVAGDRLKAGLQTPPK